MVRRYVRAVAKYAARQTWCVVIATSWPALLAKVASTALLLISAYVYVRSTVTTQDDVLLSDQASWIALAFASAVVVAVGVFLTQLLFIAPFHLWKAEAGRADALETQAPRAAEVRAQLTAAAEAAHNAQVENARNKRTLKEIRGYLEMLQADDKLQVFDRVCPGFGMSPPPKPEGDERDQRNKWSNFAQNLNDIRVILETQQGVAGLDVLGEEASRRLSAAAGTFLPSQHWPEEKDVVWPSSELRNQWLSMRARLVEYAKLREEAKSRLQAQRTPLERAKAIGHILSRMPKEGEL